jgi:ADP-ribose pyrophosphatase YjhB (NUDIX family)
MLKKILIASLCLLVTDTSASARLTALETRWLQAAEPVLRYSQQLKLPIDITVQPKPRPGDVPMAMGFDGGRCKLVLSLRENPDAEKVLENTPETERPMLIEAMAAHEIGHCWRYVQKAWHALPAGFVEAADDAQGDETLRAELKAMRETRREEGFADLVALAWTQRNHPQHYARVHAWFAAVRANQTVSGGAHDTRAWIGLASAATVFNPATGPFDDAAKLWQTGLQRQ